MIIMTLKEAKIICNSCLWKNEYIFCKYYGCVEINNKEVKE